MRRIVLLLLLFLVPQGTEAATYYVSTTGSNANPGTISQPWLTLNYALSVGSPTSCGDTIYVRAGTYASINTQAVPATSCASWANALTLRAYQSEAVHMIGIGVHAEHYLIFMDLILDGAPAGQPGETIGIAGGYSPVGTGAGHLRFINLNVHGNNSTAVTISTSSVVNVSSGSVGFNEFLGGSVHGCSGPVAPTTGAGNRCHGFYVSSPSNLVDGVDMYDIDAYPIHNFSDNPSNNIYRNNKIHACGKPGVTVFAIGIYTGTGNQVYNNIIYGCENGIEIGASSRNTSVDNNTIYGLTSPSNYRYPAIIASGGTGHKVRNNIVYNCPDNTINTGAASSPTVSNNLTTNPGFVNATGNDFRLQAGSPAIDRGVTVPSITTDFSGAARPQGSAFDIGAHEYGTNAPVAAPTNLRLNP
jgi:hypothetical protein